MMEEKELPEGWKLSKIENVADILDSMRKPINSKERAKRQGDVPYYGATGRAGWIDDFIFNEALILVGEDGAPFFDKKKNVAFEISGKSWVNNHAHVLRAKKDQTINAFVLHYLNYFDYTNYVGGTTRLKLNQRSLKTIPFPLPPLPVQKRIVSKLDVLFGHLEVLKEKLAGIPKMIEEFRQSVLTQAVTGKLTEEFNQEIGILERIIEDRSKWYQQELLFAKENKIRKPKKIVTEALNDKKHLFNRIGNRYEIAFFEQISAKRANALKAGPFGSSLKKDFYVEKGYKIYGQEQVIANDHEKGDYYINEERFNSLKSCEVSEGDILISLVGTIGKVLVIPSNFEKGIINPRLVKLSLHNELNPYFVQIYLNSEIAKSFFRQFSHGGTMDILNLSILKKLPVPLPSLQEQTEIVRRVESLFAKADAMEARYAVLKGMIDDLPQALLGKAFRGELV